VKDTKTYRDRNVVVSENVLRPLRSTLSLYLTLISKQCFYHKEEDEYPEIRSILLSRNMDD
jgi:hypothetical protein